MTEVFDRQVDREVARLRTKVAEAVLLAAAEFRMGAVSRLLARSVVVRLEPELVRVVRARFDAVHKVTEAAEAALQGHRRAASSGAEPRRPLPARPPVVGVALEKSVRPRKLYAELFAAGLQPVWKVTGSEEKPLSWRVTVTVFRPTGGEDFGFVVYRINPKSGNLVISEFYLQGEKEDSQRIPFWVDWRATVFGWAKEVWGEPELS